MIATALPFPHWHLHIPKHHLHRISDALIHETHFAFTLLLNHEFIGVADRNEFKSTTDVASEIIL